MQQRPASRRHRSWVIAALAVVACGDESGSGDTTDTGTTAGSTVAATGATATATRSSTSSTTGTTVSGSSQTTDATGDPTAATTDGDGDPLQGRGDVEMVVSGFEFVEGPVWIADEGALLFTDIPADTIHRWHPTDGLSTYASDTGALANGLTLDADGGLIVCEHGNRRVTRRTEIGTAILATDYQDTLLNSPNDAVVHPGGTVFFTDPTYGGNPEDLGFRGVFGVVPGQDPTLVSDTHEQPNGIVLSPTADVLYVSDTPLGNVTAYPVDPAGIPGPGVVLADVGNGVDGMAIDEEGNLYVSASEGVVVLRPDGTRWGAIPFPEAPANCTFGADDRRTLFVTARTSVYRVRLSVPGLAPT